MLGYELRPKHINYSKQSDQELLEAIAAKDAKAFEWVYLDNRKACMGYLLSKVIPPQEPNRERLAQAIYTDAIIDLVHNIQTGRLSVLTARLSTYINRICFNKYQNIKAKLSENPIDTSDIPYLAISPSPDTAEEERIRQMVLRHIRSLGENCRSILFQYYFLKHSHQEIAKNLGYSSSDTAKTRKQKCMQRLRQLFRNNSSSKP
ncbi:MAG: sigma-70 family RNA polymerase sigma factor [Bacteroidota bacterium]